MLFFKKKKLIEMDNKIDSLLLIIQKQQEQMSSFSQETTDLKNRQNEMKLELHEKIDTIVESLKKCILNNSEQLYKKYTDELKNLEADVKEILELHKIEKDSVLVCVCVCRNLIIEIIEKNAELMKQEINSLDRGLQMILLNSIMEQLVQE